MVLVLTQYLKGYPRKYVFTKACTTDFAKSTTITIDAATKLRTFKRSASTSDHVACVIKTDSIRYFQLSNVFRCQFKTNTNSSKLNFPSCYSI